MNTLELAKPPTKHEKAVSPELAELKLRVDNLIEERGLTTKWLYEAIGVSKQGWTDMWVNGSIRHTVLLRVAAAFRMSITELLGGSSSSNVVKEPSAPYGRAPYLEERVAALEKHIEQLRTQLNKRP
jgi:hypothetical protein